jgi:hypothetical protein
VLHIRATLPLAADESISAVTALAFVTAELHASGFWGSYVCIEPAARHTILSRHSHAAPQSLQHVPTRHGLSHGLQDATRMTMDAVVVAQYVSPFPGTKVAIDGDLVLSQRYGARRGCPHA